MKKTLFASALAIVATPAFAADAVIETPTPPIAVEEIAPVIFTWSGPYLGVQGGGSWLSGDFTMGGVRTKEHFNGGLIGAFGGYNHQFDNNAVIGLEGDINYSWNDSEVQGLGKAGTDVSGGVRARLGYAMDRALIYGAGGWTATSGYTKDPVVGKESGTLNGYTLGAGLDYAFTDNMFGRVEYRFNDYGRKNIGPANFDMQENRVTVGVGVKF